MAHPSPTKNFAHLISRHANAMPDKLALSIPSSWDDQRVTQSEEVTYGQLWARVESFRKGLRLARYRPGDRFVLMFPICVDLYALVLALFAEGMVAVLVDTGMGIGKMLQAIEDARASAFVSVSQVLKLRPALRPLHTLRCYSVDAPKGIGVRPISQLRGDNSATSSPLVPVSPKDHALITFTSGSTGRPKGADRTHGHLSAQHGAIGAHFPERVTELDCPCFPVVTLHNLCCGITTMMPAVDLRSPGTVNPAVVLDQINRHHITRLAAAPAFMRALVDYMLDHHIETPSVRALFVGGGPVSLSLCQDIVQAFPHTNSEVVYGSTEAEPMTSIEMNERLKSSGHGTLVGYVSHDATIELVNVPAHVHRLDEQHLTPYIAEHIGEVVVSGPHVNQSYIDNPKANRSNKLIQPDGTVWHRTGDLGRWDEHGRLWLVGRIKHIIEHQGALIHPFALEEQCDAIEGVARAALIQHPFQNSAVLIWARDEEASASQGIHDVMNALIAEYGLTNIPIVQVPTMPVDRRHNTKIDRVALRSFLSLHSVLGAVLEI